MAATLALYRLNEMRKCKCLRNEPDIRLLYPLRLFLLSSMTNCAVTLPESFEMEDASSVAAIGF